MIFLVRSAVRGARQACSHYHHPRPRHRLGSSDSHAHQEGEDRWGLSDPKLRARDIRAAAAQCGIPVSGAKAEAAAGLRAALEQHQPQPTAAVGETRILSIDLGLRNLAYSLISPQTRKRAEHGDDDGTDSLITGVPLDREGYSLLAWERLSLLDEAEAEAEAAPARQPDPDPFSPQSLSAVALRLVRSRLLPLRPTHVLVERQRWRSGGRAAVFEWTIRVNSLETALHAVLRCCMEEGAGGLSGTVESISPRRVAQFLLKEGEGKPSSEGVRAEEEKKGKGKKEKKKKDDVKKAKKDLVATLLRTPGAVAYGDERVKATAEAYLRRWEGKKKRSTSKSAAEKKSKKASQKKDQDKEEVEEQDGDAAAEGAVAVSNKIDDLADCLLQGLAWRQWEANKRLLAEKGVRPFLHEKGLL